jgi:hypothetical protein
MSIKHSLKIEENYLENLLSGRKRVEIRYNDRDYQVGDQLEFSNDDGYYYFEIIHIHSGLGLKDGWVALSVISESEQAANLAMEVIQ